LRAYAGVFAIEIIEHVDNPGIAISNLASLLVPGGILILSTPNVTHPYSRLRYLLRGSPFLFGLPEYWSTGHVFPIPSWLLCELCAASDLTVTNVYRAGSFELGRFKRLIIKLLSAVMYGIGTEQRPDRGDGVVAILVARN
jgi:hypothetical protein